MKKKLERFMYMGLGAVIALGGYFFGTFHSDQVDAQVDLDNISCQTLTVVDEKGNPQIHLNGVRGIIALYNKETKPIATISTSSDGGGAIALYNNKDEKLVATIGSLDGGGVIAIHNKDGKKSVLIAPTNDGSGAIAIHNKDGELIRLIQ